jgi:hypothetical protein
MNLDYVPNIFLIVQYFFFLLFLSIFFLHSALSCAPDGHTSLFVFCGPESQAHFVAIYFKSGIVLIKSHPFEII